jgi:secreted trypsin-like serine protease
MFSRKARLGAAALCAVVVCSLLAGPVAAKSPRARAGVIGGTAASLQDWGFAASILGQTTLCTGSVLSPTKVLTTAHCVTNLPTMIVRTNSTSAFTGGEVSGVASAAIDPGWVHTFSNDVAVLTLKTPTTAPPIQLASADEDAAYDRPGGVLSVAGFGERNPLIVGRSQIGVLSSADVLVRRCGAPAWAICDAGGRAGTALRRFRGHKLHRKVWKTICQGDSGGPLVARTPNGPRLVGIAEASSAPPKRNPFFFVRCGLKGFPSIHTRTLSYAGFIQANATSP